MDYVISTQDIENYGMHDSSNPEHYWKFKGGETMVVRNAPERTATVIAVVNLVKVRRHDFMYFQSYIHAHESFEMGTLPRKFEDMIKDGWAEEIDWSKLSAEADWRLSVETHTEKAERN